MRLNKLSILIFIFVVHANLFSCKKATKPNPVVITPEINIQDAFQVRKVAGSTIRFYVYSNKISTSIVSVDFTLIDGTATSPKDYVAASGTILIPANQTQTTIDVQINEDVTDLRQSNLQFTVQLNNPKNCTLVTTFAKGIIVTEDGSYLPTDSVGYITPLSYAGYSLVWNDEFSGSGLDANIWNQEIGNNNGWGNSELEYYTNSLKNIFLSNGILIIEARKETVGNFYYTSGRITTQNKKNFKFGRIDIRAKLPVGKGVWPALWMLGEKITTVSWPACGEIDIMELIGTYPGRVYSTMHWKNSSGTHDSKGANYILSSGDFSQQFHVYSIVWALDQINCYVDDQLYLTVTLSDVGSANYPFNANQFFLFNVAVGGQWPGSPDSTTAFPQRMFVDYVRVFQ